MKKLRRWVIGIVMAVTMFLSSCGTFTPYTGIPDDEVYQTLTVIENNSK